MTILSKLDGEGRMLARTGRAASLAVMLILVDRPANADVPVQTDKVVAQSRVPALQYYSQVRVEVVSTNLPNDASGKKKLGKALLEALHIESTTRTIAVTMTLSTNSTKLPEYPILTYNYASDKSITSISQVGSFSSPLWRLDSSEPLRVQLSYRYSTSQNFQVQALSDALINIVPSGALVSTASKPLIDNVASLANTLLSNSPSVSVSQAEDLHPYASGLDTRALTFKLQSPSDGSTIATVRVTLRVTPTLLRSAIDLNSANPPSDFQLQETEAPSDIALNLAGVKKYPLYEAEALPEYAVAVRDRTAAAARAFCAKAIPLLAQTYSLTAMDRVLSLHQALTDANYTQSDNAWYFQCFTGADLTTANLALKINPSPTIVPPNSTEWPVAMKDLIGCWITGQTGPTCRLKGAGSRDKIEAIFAPEVSIGIIDLVSVDISDLPPSRTWPRARLVDRLRGKADRFGCYFRGLGVNAGQPSRGYNIIVALKNNLITNLAIVNADPDILECH